MEERRKTARFITKLKAQYRLKDEEDLKECTIINVSREGMGITFQTRDRIKVDSTIHLRIVLPENPKTVEVIGKLRWIEERADNFIGGIEWYRVDRVF